jgi:hypothetical protein
MRLALPLRLLAAAMSDRQSYGAHTGDDAHDENGSNAEHQVTYMRVSMAERDSSGKAVLKAGSPDS